MDLEEDTFIHAKVAAATNLMILLHALITMQQHGSQVRYVGRHSVQQQRMTLLSRTPGNAVWDQAVQDQDYAVDQTVLQLV